MQAALMQSDRKASLRLVCIFIAGTIAAAQLGKMPPLIPLMSADLRLSVLVGGLVVSFIELSGALLALPAAGLATRIGCSRGLISGLLLLGAGSLVGAFAPSGEVLLVGRAIESLGYLAVIVTAPVLMTDEAKQIGSSLALALWSTFLPIGLSVGLIASGLIADLFHWRVPLFFWAAVGLAFVVLLFSLSRGMNARAEKPEKSFPSPASLALALGFGCFTCFQVGALAIYPQFLMETKAASAAMAGAITGIGGFVTITGVLVPLQFARKFPGRRLRLSPTMLFLSLVLPAVLLFPTFSVSTNTFISSGLFIALNLVSGIFPALVFASMPRFAGPGGIAAANGAIAQAGAMGSLLGPPAYAVMSSHAGWQGVAILGMAVSFAALVVLHVLEHRSASLVER